MELQIKPIEFPEVIEFNFSELKAETLARVEKYKNFVYTDEQIGIAKTDLASLRKFTKALSDERIKVKNDCLRPYEAFEQRIKELTAIVDDAIGNIDRQVKEYAETKKMEKHTEILKLWDSISANPDFPEWLTLEAIFNDKWLNASVTMATVEKEINARLEQIAKDLEILREMPEFAFEAIETYKHTLDVNKAITEGKRMSELAKMKAESVTKYDTPTIPPLKINNSEAEAPEIEEVCFKAWLTVDEAKALRLFFNTKGIKFEKVG